jgi:putative transposase
MKLNIFGELFPVAPELAHEYVVATIDVKVKKFNYSWTKTKLMSSIVQSQVAPRSGE